MDRRKTLGVLYVLGAGFGFALMGLFVRMAGDIPTFEKVFFRNLIAAVITSALIVQNRKTIALNAGDWGYLFLRALCGTVGVICNFYALDHMNIADASILNKLSPFFAVAGGYFLIKEKLHTVDVLALMAAFTGAVFVAKPGANMAFLVALIGAAGGLLAGLAYTFVRILSKRGTPGYVIIFSFSAFSCLSSLPFIMMDFTMPSFPQLCMLLGSGCAGMMGQLCITRAYTCAPAKEISVFDYTQVVFSALLGFVFLGQIPDHWSVMGYGIIIGTAIMKWQYNLRRGE